MEKCPYCGGEMEVLYCNEYVGGDGYIHGGVEYECKECDALDFNGLFSDILKFLREKDDPTDVEAIARNFSFERLDQDSMTL